MGQEPGSLWITFGMVTRVAVVAHVVALLGQVTRCATVAFVLEDGNRMVGFVPALRMWQLNAVTRCAEVRLDMTRRTRLATLAGDDVCVGGGPGIALNTFGVVTGVTVAACFPDLCGPVTIDTAGFSGFQERPRVLVLVPTIRVGHLDTVAGIAELLLLVARRARGIRIGEADTVPADPIGLHVARWSGNHGEGVARRARQRGDRVDAVAVEARLHGRFDGRLVDMGLDRMTRTATDRIGHCVVFGMIEDQGRRSVTRPDLIEVEMTLRTTCELGIADDGGCWCRQLVR
jgi:hypothetical protein